MAAKIGILGESTDRTVGVVTVYTVPADKAARVKILFGLIGSSGGGGYQYKAGSPGSEQTMRADIAGNGDQFYGMQLSGSEDVAGNLGYQVGTGILGLANFGGTHVMVPLMEYFLSTGDTVIVEISGGETQVDHLFQVHGVEDDA